jgi:hypothetical protein
MVTDDLDYLWTLATLRILDRLAGPLPDTPADKQRARSGNGYRRRTPRSSRKEFGAAEFPPADRFARDLH